MAGDFVLSPLVLMYGRGSKACIKCLDAPGAVGQGVTQVL